MGEAVAPCKIDISCLKPETISYMTKESDIRTAFASLLERKGYTYKRTPDNNYFYIEQKE
jgi:hypothetical protein